MEWKLKILFCLVCWSSESDGCWNLSNFSTRPPWVTALSREGLVCNNAGSVYKQRIQGPYKKAEQLIAMRVREAQSKFSSLRVDTINPLQRKPASGRTDATSATGTGKRKVRFYDLVQVRQISGRAGAKPGNAGNEDEKLGAAGNGSELGHDGNAQGNASKVKVAGQLEKPPRNKSKKKVRRKRELNRRNNAKTSSSKRTSLVQKSEAVEGSGQEKCAATKAGDIFVPLEGPDSALPLISKDKTRKCVSTIHADRLTSDENSPQELAKRDGGKNVFPPIPSCGYFSRRLKLYSDDFVKRSYYSSSLPLLNEPQERRTRKSEILNSTESIEESTELNFPPLTLTDGENRIVHKFYSNESHPYRREARGNQKGK